MFIFFHFRHFFRSTVVTCGFVLLVGSVSPLLAEQDQWVATSSALQEDIYPAVHVIDGDFSTRWSSPASDPQHIVIDFGGRTPVSGLVLHWETAFSSAYAVEISENGKDWTRVFQEQDGDGRRDYVFFPEVETRFMRLFMTKRGTGWGHSLWEIAVLGAQQGMRVMEPSGLSVASLIDDGTATCVSVGVSTNLVLDLGRSHELSGIRVDWGERFATDAKLWYSQDGREWTVVSELDDGTGRFDYFLSAPFKARYLALAIVGASGDTAAVDIARITLRGPSEVLTDYTRYAIAAQKARRGLYPLQLLGEQVYWTIFGIPDDAREALLDEYGNAEMKSHGSILMPYVFMDGKLRSAQDGQALRQHLVKDCLPIPSVAWHDHQLQMSVSALGWGQPGDAGAFLRYSLRNESTSVRTGTLFLAMRPIQINPVWQHGGLSAIHAFGLVTNDAMPVVQIDGRDEYVLMTPPGAFGSCGFDRGDVVRYLEKGIVPESLSVDASSPLNSGALAYDFSLEPGAQTNIYVAAPLQSNVQVAATFAEAAPSLDMAWTVRSEAVQKQWTRLVNQTALALPDEAVANTVRSQLAYILLNRDGRAIQPGSRHYERSWIRDGAMTCAALLRWGHPKAVREFIEWYTHFLTPEGMVPPSFRADDPLDAGPGSGIEWDGQGAYISLVMDYYRFSQDRTFLEEHFEYLVASMRFLQQLREQTLKEDYLAGVEARERFVGILPKSFSHEGYYPEMHSYWDDFWALKGWKDGAAAARLLERDDIVDWADEQHDLLAKAVESSIQRTIDYKKINHIPGCAEKGDFDPTSTSIVFFPCVSSLSILPRVPLMAMYDRYHEELESRLLPEWNVAYTPYEVRNVMAFVSLGQFDRAHALLDMLMDDRRPAVWNHWAEVVLSDERMGCYIGDMPHTWAGSGFLNTIALMLAREYEGQLFLLKGVPASWFDGTGVALERRPTWFGALDLTARRYDDEFQITIGYDVAPPEGFLIWISEGDRAGKVRVNGEIQSISADGIVRYRLRSECGNAASEPEPLP